MRGRPLSEDSCGKQDPLSIKERGFCDVLLDELDNGVYIVFRVLQEAEKELHGAVSCTSAHAAVGSIEPVNAVADCFDSVGECKLLVVVCVDTKLLAVLISVLGVECGDTCYLLGVE